ncbi:hypothetical protein TVD_13370 [Thioalkalivibrio versutus]|uniref:Uncharacterized protein n=1 Tax=Thioalkalivibrio versutus TaxID=106634 RepID=A0A0G3G7C9_9GAMM|nr:porin [Thioalkalivibrio versutus]AKJ96289.1 hypothetical protein TVD_13370 [Thioalkalivibrio versutus]
MKTTTRWALKSLVFATALGLAAPAQSANWLMLQGTEPEDAAARAHFWGFVQPGFKHDASDPNPGGAYVPPKLIGPDLTSQSGFNLNRARIGARGTGFPLDGRINYFIMAELGNNGITQPGNSFAKLTDASITLNHLPGARVRVGLFKTPGSEEVFQGIVNLDYIEFTNFANQQLIERLPNDRYTSNMPPQPMDSAGDLNRFDKSVAAGRDTGIQVFDTFEFGDWEHSYAVMVGNGNGLNVGDMDNNRDTYLYWSSEYIFGGQGPRVEGVKMFAWDQRGKRRLDHTNDGVHNPETFDRERRGLGVRYLKKPWRIAAEYGTAEGMIWVGPHAPTFDMNPAVPAGNGVNGKADGYQVDVGYYIPNTKWEVAGRYDIYNRLKNDPFETRWETLTLAAQYHFNPKTRLTLNYIMRDVEAVNFPSGAGPNANVDGIGNRTAIQLTHIF